MAIHLSDSFLEELRFRNDIESVVSSYVQLRRRGHNAVGLCPFHNEKTPSFTVDTDKGLFYCFGCGAGGNVITFIQKIENLDFLEAVRFLANRAGMQMPEDTEEPNLGARRVRILEMNRAAARHFHDNLMSPRGEAALRYLTERGLSRKTIRHFGLGYAPDSWDDLRDHLRGLGYSYEEMKAAFLLSEGRKGNFYDIFRNRVIFPIIDLRGDVVAFGGRDLGERGPKYLNSSDTLAFRKNRNLFALNFAKNAGKGHLILAEGYMDVIALHQAGFTEAVATLGTALTQEQAHMMTRYTGEVILCYDSDGAGQKATQRAMGLLDGVGLKVRVVRVTDAKDPDEFIKRFGATRFQLLLDGGAGATEYALLQAREGLDLSKTAGRSDYLKRAAELLADLRSPIERDVYAGRLSEEFGVAKTALLEQIGNAERARRRAKERKENRDLRVAPPPPASRPDPERQRNLPSAIAEEQLIALLGKNPDFIPAVAAELPPEAMSVSANRRIYEAMLARSAGHLSVDPGGMGALLDTDTIARYTGILIQHEALTGSRRQAEDYVRAIRSYREKKSAQDIRASDVDEWAAYMQQTTEQKRKGR